MLGTSFAPRNIIFVALEQEAEAILRRCGDQDFSYADAVSFALMKARGIKEAFAFAKHLATIGFRRVPASRR